MGWNEKFLKLAFAVADWSKDTSTKVGCVITGPGHEILTTGYNGMPRKINDNVPERYERPEKYRWFEHAERNAIYNAARIGVKLEGSTLYMASTMPGPPCVDCCRAIIQSGITNLVTSAGDDDPTRWPERWRESMEVSAQMIRESQIEWRTVKLD